MMIIFSFSERIDGTMILVALCWLYSLISRYECFSTRLARLESIQFNIISNYKHFCCASHAIQDASIQSGAKVIRSNE